MNITRLMQTVFPKKTKLVNPDEALSGRDKALFKQDLHQVQHNTIVPPFPEQMEVAVFGFGCFWGAERTFWLIPGVYTTSVGYAGGSTKNPTYEEVCSGRTGHNEVVQVVFDPSQISYQALLTVFFEAHDPTQGMRQGNDIGTQYRSGIYTLTEAQHQLAVAAKADYQQALQSAGYSEITTEIVPLAVYYFAEPYHQQYLAKNSGGYCGLGGTGVNVPETSSSSA